MEKDLPTLREMAGGTWQKEEDLKQLKSEVAALDRKIQLTLASTLHEAKEGIDQKSETEEVRFEEDVKMKHSPSLSIRGFKI